MLDIDITSAYHPQRDAFAVENLVSALEPLGLVSYVACTSSYTNGIHLYFPLQQPQRSWEVAAAVAALLEKAGFGLIPGQLELFPNPRPYIAGTQPSLFQAHRLPMQLGSYLLNQSFQPIWSDRFTFVQQWQSAQNRNVLNTRLFKRLVQSQQRTYQISGKAEKFMADLNAEVEAGWTGFGQTNHLLGRIALRTYVFHHILFGGEPLMGQALADQIVAIARSLPGYQTWCQHQHEIEKRATEWARCVEGSRYFPYGARRAATETLESVSSVSSASSLSWNQQQSAGARERIRLAISQLLEANALPAETTARFRALTQFGIGGSSLYRHKDLWHPNHLVENPPDPPTLNDELVDCAEGASTNLNSTSLFPSIGGNVFQHQALAESIDRSITSGCNTAAANRRWTNPCSVDQYSIDQRMQQFLDSGDPILVAEALSYFQQQQVNRQRSTETQGGLVLDHELEDLGRLQFFTKLGSDTVQSTATASAVLASTNLEDWSDLLATITVEIRRLGWTKEQVICHLWQQFGKLQQSRLSHGELGEWLEWLKTCRLPAKTG